MTGESAQDRRSVAIPLGGEWFARSSDMTTEIACVSEEAARKVAGPSGAVDYRPRMVQILQPDEGQAVALTRVMRLIEKGENARAVMLFGDVLDALFVRPEDYDYAYSGLAGRRIELVEYANLASEALRHFEDQDADAPPAAPQRRAARVARRR